MNTKAIRKQLGAAVVMCMVAALALGTSTFAWFVNNNSVKAEGISINAVADSSLLIKGQTETDFTSVGTVTLQKTLKPATSVDGAVFGHLTDQVIVESAASAAATWSNDATAPQAGDIAKVTDANKETYYAEATYNMKALGTPGQNSTVYAKEITLTGDAKLVNSVRVSVTVGDTTYIYNAGQGGLLEGGAGEFVSEAEGVETWKLSTPDYITRGADGTYADSANFEVAEIAAVSAASVTDVVVRVWFEGQDQSCKSNNIDAANTAVSIEFAKKA